MKRLIALTCSAFAIVLLTGCNLSGLVSATLNDVAGSYGVNLNDLASQAQNYLAQYLQQ